MASDEQRKLFPFKCAKDETRKFGLEPALIFIFFGWNLAMSIIPNQLLQEACLSYGHSRSDCTTLGESKETKNIEEEIQPLVAEIITIQSLLKSTIPAVLCLFLVPWSDKFGRKKVICATFFGYSTSLALFAVISCISDVQGSINPWFYVLPFIPYVLTGGWPTMLVSILCYITDTSSESNRSTRLAVVEIIVFVGVLTGTASSSYILQMINPTGVFMMSMVFVTLASIYGAIALKESVKVLSLESQFKELFSLVPIIEMIKTCFKSRSMSIRKILWCLIGILTISVISTNGSGNLFYLFVREKFQWTLKEATIFESTSVLISIMGLCVGLVVLKKVLKFSDDLLAVVAIISLFINSLLIAFAQSSTQMYFANVICLFKILASPMCRSLIASVTPKREIGKVFSFISTFEATCGLIATPFYTFVYERTFTSFVGAFYILTASAAVINLILMLHVMLALRQKEKTDLRLAIIKERQFAFVNSYKTFSS